ncbi:hypothetical protein [uncultured Tateyamaria sp.]|uniref:hypothetical protein n=1 Tax=Tateyamaria sp. 1078 TaxID=3417464 RepID=UPI00261ABC73|nr:hypothetical protein [uncultured Tateyamaria sp.]
MRYSLSGWDVAALFGGLAVLAALNVVQLLPEPERAVEPAVPETVQPVRDQPMTDDMLWHYDRWDRRNSAVAVFARGETAFGWVNSYIDETVARTDALAWCAQHGEDCEVMEVRAGLGTANGIDIPLTPRLVTIVDRVRATPGSVALAVAGTGAYGIGRGASADVAVKNAEAVCAKMAIKDRPAFLPVHPCKVIYQR